MVSPRQVSAGDGGVWLPGEGVGSSSTSGEQPRPAVLPAYQVTQSAPDQALLCKQQLCLKLESDRNQHVKMNLEKLLEEFVPLNLVERGSSSMSHLQL